MGLPGMMPGEIRRDVTDKALAKRVLCDRHNSALSSLDEVGKRLAALRKVVTAFKNGSATMSFALFHGADVERFVLKTLCGLMAAHMLGADDKTLPDQPPIEWLRILFGLDELGPRRGLYFGTKRVVGASDGRAVMAPLLLQSRATGAVAVGGLQLAFSDITLVLAMRDEPLDHGEGDADFVGFVHRPHYIVFTDGPVTKTIHFYWPDGVPPGARLDLTFVPRPAR
jgi:hypothetical protein